MNGTKQRKAGVVLAYGLLFLDTIINIVYTPLLLKNLGDSQYGLYQLIGSLVNYFAIMDLGLGSTITRYIVKYNAEGKITERNNFFAMGLIVYGLISTIIAVAGSIVYFSIGGIFPKLSHSEVSQAKVLFVFLIVNLMITMFDHAFSGAMTAGEQFIAEKSIKIARVILRAFLVLALVSFYRNAVVIVVVDFVLTLVILIIKMGICTKQLGIIPKLVKFDFVLFREIFVFTFAIFLQSIINQFNNNVDKTVLGMFKDTAMVAVYSVAMQLYSAYSGLSLAIHSVYLPKISRVVFKGGTDEEITDSLIQPSRMQFMILAAVCGGFWLYGKQFIRLWCNKEEAWIIACIIMTAATIELFQNCTTSVLKAKKLLLGRTLIDLGVAIGNFGLTVLLVPHYGMIGAAIGTVFSLIVGYAIANNIYYHFKVGIIIPRFFKGVLHRTLPAASLGIIIGALFKLIPGDSWISFIVRIIGFICVYFLIMFFVGMNNSEKKEINALLARMHLKKNR